MEYLIMDEDHSSLTRAILRTSPTAPVLEFEIPEQDVHLLEGLVNLQFVGFDEHSPSFEGRVARRRGNRMAVEKGKDLGDAPLENLRVPYDHETFVYPVSGQWEGRLTVQTTALSCGGLAFLSPRGFMANEVVQVALHIREGALLVHGKVVGQELDGMGKMNSVIKFMSGVGDVEQMVRREVLYLQLKQRDDKKDGKVNKKLFYIQ